MEPENVKVISEWVKKGGVLALFANDLGNCELDKFNELAKVFGISFNKDSKYKVLNNDYTMGRIKLTEPNTILKTAKEIYVKEISTLSVKDPAKSTLTVNGDIIMATAKYGKGTVFVIGDPWLYNEYTDGRRLPYEYQNFTAAQDLSSWLIAQSKGKLVIMKKQIIFLIVALFAISVVVSAQTRQPSTAIRPFLVRSKQSLEDLEKKLAADKTDAASKSSTVTKVEDLIGGAGMETRVAVQHDTRRGGELVELHDKSDDVYYVLKGEATLELGGTLVDPKEVSPGEWRSKTVNGSQNIVIKVGDLVMVPRGTPHRRTVTGKGFSMILIKIYEDPLPAK